MIEYECFYFQRRCSLVKSTHAKQQIDYGLQNGYETLILAISREDNTKGEYVSSMDLERALEFLKTKVKTMIIQKLYNLLFQVSSLVARDRSAWLKGTEENYYLLAAPYHLPLLIIVLAADVCEDLESFRDSRERH